MKFKLFLILFLLFTLPLLVKSHHKIPSYPPIHDTRGARYVGQKDYQCIINDNGIAGIFTLKKDSSHTYVYRKFAPDYKFDRIQGQKSQSYAENIKGLEYISSLLLKAKKYLYRKVTREEKMDILYEGMDSLLLGVYGGGEDGIYTFIHLTDHVDWDGPIEVSRTVITGNNRDNYHDGIRNDRLGRCIVINRNNTK